MTDAGQQVGRGGRRAWWRGGIAVVWAGGLVLFFIPMGDVGIHEWGGVSLAGIYHTLYFAFAAWGALFWTRWRGSVAIWVGMALLAAGVEGLQPAFGRTCEWLDWIYGASGAAVVCLAFSHGAGPGRWGLGLVGLVGVLWGPVACHWVRYGIPEKGAFPVLADFEASWGQRGWELNGVALGEGGRMLPMAGGGGAYPGLFRTPAVCDWRGVQAFRCQVFWPMTNPVTGVIRVDDRAGNPPYAERFQMEWTLTNGWNDIWIGREELGKTSGGRSMDLGHIHLWGVFLVSPGPFDYFSLRAVRLDLNKNEETAP